MNLMQAFSRLGECPVMEFTYWNLLINHKLVGHGMEVNAVFVLGTLHPVRIRMRKPDGSHGGHERSVRLTAMGTCIMTRGLPATNQLKTRRT